MLRQHPDRPSPDATAIQVAISAAHGRARRLKCSLRAQAADEQDFQQAVLVDLIGRADRFEACRGAWPAFVCVVTRNAAAHIAKRWRRRATLETAFSLDDDFADDTFDAAAADMAIDFKCAIARLPPHLQTLVDRIAETGNLACAQRASAMSTASFYRALRDLRLRLISEGSSIEGRSPFKRNPNLSRRNLS